MIDSDEVLVASTHSGETTFSTSANTCFLTDISSKTASITKSASANTSLLSTAAGHQGLEAVRLVLAHPALGEELVDLGVDVAHALVDPVLVEVGEDHGHREAAYEQERQLAGHQARADDADLGDRAGQRPVGAPAGRLARFCTRSKA